ncbi:hypothetical protein [Stetteria hydrogenophila]
MAVEASITKKMVLEQLSSMAREVAYASGRVSRALAEGRVEDASNAAGEAEQVVSTTYYRLLDFLASGRIAFLDNADLYLFIARSIHSVARRVEASLFRLSLLDAGQLPAEVVRGMGAMAAKVKEAAGLLDSALNLLASGSRDSRDLVGGRIKRILELEDEVDSEYRSLLTWLLSERELPAGKAVILKEAMDLMERAMDELNDAASHLKVVAEAG